MCTHNFSFYLFIEYYVSSGNKANFLKIWNYVVKNLFKYRKEHCILVLKKVSGNNSRTSNICLTCVFHWRFYLLAVITVCTKFYPLPLKDLEMRFFKKDISITARGNSLDGFVFAFEMYRKTSKNISMQSYLNVFDRWRFLLCEKGVRKLTFFFLFLVI